MEEKASKRSFWSFDNFALAILLGGLWLLPIFVLPFWSTPLEISKHLFLVSIVFISFVLWLFGRLQAGKLILPRNLIVVGAFLVSFVTLLSAATSGFFWISFAGLGHELDTFLTIFSVTILLFLFGVYFQSRQRFLTAYIGIFVVAILFFLSQFLALIILRTDWLVVGQSLFLTRLFNDLLTSLIGKWYDFGVYSGFILLSSLIMLEFFSLKKTFIFKVFIIACFILSLLSLIFINYRPVWIVLGLFALILFIYRISFWQSYFGNNNEDHLEINKVDRFLHPSFAVILVALFFIILGSPDKFGQNINNWRDRWQIPVFEIRPSWSGTWSVAQKTLTENPLLGVGPNRFVNEWIKSRPSIINQTAFWNVDFRYGIGLIPSALVTIGLLGFLAWLFFLGAIFWYGLRFIFTTKQDKSTRALLLLSFLGSVYLWLFAIFYVPDTALLTLTFLVTGLFVAILVDTKIIKYGEISLMESPQHSFLTTLIFVVLIIGTIVVGYFTIQKYISVYIFQKGLQVFNYQVDLNEAYLLIDRATNLSNQDLYYRTLSEIDLQKIHLLLRTTDLPKEELRARFLAQVDLAIRHAIKATNLDASNHLNWLTLGRVYETLVPLGVDNAYNQSQMAFDQAKKLKPDDPSMLLNYYARLEISNKNLAKARSYVRDSLAIKADYVPAVSLLSQIDAQEGNLDVATRRLEEFLIAYPQYNNDAGLYFQLGFLHYQRENYQEAVRALKKATAIIPNFSNAKYFLGLSYRHLGDRSQALEQFQDVARLNPDNQEVKQFIQELLMSH